MTNWVIWVLSAVVLLAAGFAVLAVPRLRQRDLRRRTAWSTARAAIERAAVSRDAASVRQAEAEQLFARAETIAASHGGVRAAETAYDCAHRADLLWREATGG